MNKNKVKIYHYIIYSVNKPEKDRYHRTEGVINVMELQNGKVQKLLSDLDAAIKKMLLLLLWFQIQIKLNFIYSMWHFFSGYILYLIKFYYPHIVINIYTQNLIIHTFVITNECILFSKYHT